MAEQPQTGSLKSRTAIVVVFETFRNELDEHNDRRERLIKNSRDVTNLSKKVIFLLHRIMTEDEPTPKPNNDRASRAAAKGREKLKEVQNLFASIRGEVEGDRFWRYQRNVSPGLQEYIEALSFAHYLDTGALISFNQVQQSLSDEHGVPYFPLTLEDYLLGLSDLTGELMRYAISAISQRGGRTIAREVCTFVRSCRADFETLTPYYKELRKKQAVTSQSLQKIEDATYAIAVRTSEYDLPPEMLDDVVAMVSGSYGRGSGEDQSQRKRPRPDDDGGDDD
ncbi:Translin [Irpex rosettiformis]|uniref:Translin n=1 Tax=Irpex rosettiformis TaxID=378272 RepID=A0ACB8UK21_9APHY|nr:Translin [Irpex rosettiformis]